MFNKIYSKIKDFIKENLFFIIFTIMIFVVFSIPIPYYIDAPGGLINLEEKVVVLNGNKSKGSLNLTYVSSYEGNIGTYFISKFNKSWDLVPIGEVIHSNENKEDLNIRNKIMLENSLSNAYYVAYNYLKKDFNVISSSIYVVYIDENAETNINIGDRIIKLDDTTIKSIDDILNYLSTKKIGDKIKIIVNDGEEKYIIVKELDDRKSILISAICNYDYSSDVKFNFKNSESGPSGGLMIALSIYNQNIKKDITNGNKIAGTGTIDMNGNVGEISGIKYKIMGAVKEKVDIFFLPYANYEEAKRVVKENKYNINLVPVKTFVDAINYLNK